MKAKLFFVTPLFFCLAYAVQKVAAQPISNNPTAQQYYEQAQYYLRGRDFAKALIELREALALDKDNANLHNEYAAAFLGNKQNGNAALIIDKALLLPTANEKTYQIATEIYTAKSEYGLAKKTIAKGIEKYPNSALLQHSKATLYYTYREDAIAIEAWKKALLLDPTFMDSYLALAKAYDTAQSNIAHTIFLTETFLLQNPLGPKAKEAKLLLYRCFLQLHKYANLPANTSSAPSAKKKDPEADAPAKQYLRKIKANRYLLIGKFSIASLQQLRERCAKDYSGSNTPALIQYQKRLIHEQFFSLYHQFLFGELYNGREYEEWLEKNAADLNLLKLFFVKNPFTITKP